MPWEEKASPSLRPESTGRRDAGSAPPALSPPRPGHRPSASAPGLHSPGPLGRTGPDALDLSSGELVQLFCDAHSAWHLSRVRPSAPEECGLREAVKRLSVRALPPSAAARGRGTDPPIRRAAGGLDTAATHCRDASREPRGASPRRKILPAMWKVGSPRTVRPMPGAVSFKHRSEASSAYLLMRHSAWH